MTTVLHISDTHFGTERPAVMAALLRLARAQAPDVLVVSGDITQRARGAQFAAARTYIDALAVPRSIVLPGNHDIPLFDLAARLFRPYARYASAFGPQLEPELECEDVLVIGVNTTRAARHKHGEVSREQIDRVASRLVRARPAQLRIVVTHHPVLVTRESDVKNLLRGHRQAVDAWTAAGAHLLLGGHIHLPYLRPLAEPHRDGTACAWVLQAGTAVSSRVRPPAPNSVNLIRYDALVSPRSCVVEIWSCRAVPGDFECVETTRIPCLPATPKEHSMAR
jgi:3',5'-cyclic AMP phosphodiesterase CpdA